jgi:hypothetical protein
LAATLYKEKAFAIDYQDAIELVNPISPKIYQRYWISLALGCIILVFE